MITSIIHLATSQPEVASLTRSDPHSIRFICNDRKGQLIDIEGIDKLVELVGCDNVALYRKNGDTLTFEHDFRDRIGHVIYKTSLNEPITQCLNNLKLVIKEG